MSLRGNYCALYSQVLEKSRWSDELDAWILPFVKQRDVSAMLPGIHDSVLPAQANSSVNSRLYASDAEIYMFTGRGGNGGSGNGNGGRVSMPTGSNSNGTSPRLYSGGVTFSESSGETLAKVKKKRASYVQAMTTLPSDVVLNSNNTHLSGSGNSSNGIARDKDRGGRDKDGKDEVDKAGTTDLGSLTLPMPVSARPPKSRSRSSKPSKRVKNKKSLVSAAWPLL